MALISSRNLVAPLTNKVHLISLVLLAVAFAALRFAGGSLSVEREPGREVSNRQANVVEKKKDDHVQERVKGLRDSIDLPWEKKQPDQKKQDFPKPDKKDGGLAEIEKSLGL